MSKSLRSYISGASASWRADRARLLARLGRSCDRRFGDDEFTRLAVMYHRCTAAGTLADAAKRFPMLAAVAGAFELAEGPEIERLAVQARLIALEDVVAIASKSGKPAAVIEAYEKLFLDFRERHDGSSWIHDKVIRGQLSRDHPQSLRSAVMTLAYRGGGPAVADALVAAVGVVGMECSWDTLFKASRAATIQQRMTLMAITTVMAPRNQEAAARLGKQYRKLLRETGLVFRDLGNGPTATSTDAPPQPLWERFRSQMELALVAPAPKDSNIGVA